MKKLILIAGVIAMAGAFADCVYLKPKAAKSTDAAWAYKWKFTGKTTKAVDAYCSGKWYVSRTAAALKIQGWTLYCDPVCDDFEDVGSEYFWQTKPSKTLLDAEFAFEVANQIGKNGKNYEAAGEVLFVVTETTGSGKTKTESSRALYNLTFAGLGKYDTKKERVKSVSGNFAGIAFVKSKGTDCEDGAETYAWECCGCPKKKAPSVAYGKWSVKYNKSIAKKVANNKLEYKHIYPKWAR